MSLAILHSRAVFGISAKPVTIEVHLSRGLPGFGIVGLAETAVKESRQRVRSAIINSDYSYPSRRIIVNLAPADLPKEGGGFDLAIAIGILAASGQVPKTNLLATEFIGELALDGTLRPVSGALPIALAAHAMGHELILPAINAVEASLISHLIIRPVRQLSDVVEHLTGKKELLLFGGALSSRQPNNFPDLEDVLGQPQAKRVLEIAACGRHHLLFSGPPGSGKTMLASRITGIMPPLTQDEALETAAVYSVSGQELQYNALTQRPFRAPHHTASSVALIGGGSKPRPGEVSLAHNGILFLDEFPEFHRHVLEVLREPLESREVMISRASFSAKYPAGFQLIAAMNPCPCGYLGDKEHDCNCTEAQVQRYRAKISGPLLDRIDLHLEVPRISAALLFAKKSNEETSATVQQRVIKARDRQLWRGGKCNAALSSREISQFCHIDSDCEALLVKAINQFALSTRCVHRILKVTRTIADMDGQDQIGKIHVSEALCYRLFE